MGSIYLVLNDGRLAEMTETSYESEDLLQMLISRYPSLLAGEHMAAATPRRWMLVSREVPLASESGGLGRWSVDHVFLDQDAVPTLVEVKRSSDTRIRREVVGQMLDYAANAVVYWPITEMMEQFRRRCDQDASDPLSVFSQAFGVVLDVEAAWERYWEQAKLNLEAGRIRMVFLADRIPPELRRIVEFLNQQMDPAEVLAVEVKQYLGQGQRALVPRVIGQTAAAQQRKTSSTRLPRRQWDEDQFFQELSVEQSQEIVAVARSILAWARSRDLDVRWGTGGARGTFVPCVTIDGRWFEAPNVRTDGKIDVVFRSSKASLPHIGSEELAREFWARLNAIDGITIDESRLLSWQELHMGPLTHEAALTDYLETLDWFFQQVGRSVP